MSVAAWIAFVGAALFVLLVAEWKEAQRAIAVVKPLVSSGFVGVALASGATDSSYGLAILAALLLSWLGDVLLIPKGAKRAFLAGLVAFLVAHLAFAGAFLMGGVDPVVVAATTIPLAIAAATVGRYLVRAAPANLKGPVVGYIAVISIMVAAAAGAVGVGAPPRIIVGAVIFYGSDLTVARERFVQKSWWNRAVGLPLYYGAQVLFATSVA